MEKTMSEKNGFLISNDVFYEIELNPLLKGKKEPSRPLFEAFINAWEASDGKKDKNNITIDIHFQKETVLFEEQIRFDSLVIEDNGIGFTEKSFERFQMLRNPKKGKFNKGIGRIQFLKCFVEAHFYSAYLSKDGCILEREFVFSNSKSFLERNALIRIIKKDILSEKTSTRTKLVLKETTSDKVDEFYLNLSVDEIKDELIKHFLPKFLTTSGTIPNILIRQFIDNEEKDSAKITSNDITSPDYEKTFNLNFETWNGNEFEKSQDTESFTLYSFLMEEKEQEKNILKYVSKGEVSRPINLSFIKPKRAFSGKRFLFLLISNYLNSLVSEDREKIKFPTRDRIKKKMISSQKEIFEEKYVFEDTLDAAIKKFIINKFPETGEEIKKKDERVEEIKKFFLLKGFNLGKVNFSISDSNLKILEKMYKQASEAEAKKNIMLFNSLEKAKKLNPADDDYQEQVKRLTEEMTHGTEVKGQFALTSIVSRRKIILEVFEKLLLNTLEHQEQGTHPRVPEEALHNLFFQKHSTSTQSSDMWLFNEEFIYFNGVSEQKLGQLQINGENVLKEKLSKEEKQYITKQKSDAKEIRTDILLFPAEGKCIIIEFKAPDVKVSEHLNQINRYASLINNLSKDKYEINTYYAYLVGERLDIDDIQDNDSDFQSAHSLGFIFRPHKRIIGKFGKKDGSLYTEIIKFSTLLDRAKLRNLKFINALGLDESSSNSTRHS